MNTIPSTLVAPTLDTAMIAIADATDDIEKLAAKIEWLIRLRAGLLEDARRQLDAIGCDTFIEDLGGNTRIPRGAIRWAQESHSPSWTGKVCQSLSINHRWRRDDEPRIDMARSIWKDNPDAMSLVIPRGRWRCLLNDEGRHLFARVTDDDLGHHESIPRLRNWARKSDLRVRSGGRVTNATADVQLIDPMGYVAHEGTIASAFRWLAGYDIEPLEAQ